MMWWTTLFSFKLFIIFFNFLAFALGIHFKITKWMIYENRNNMRKKGCFHLHDRIPWKNIDDHMPNQMTSTHFSCPRKTPHTQENLWRRAETGWLQLAHVISICWSISVAQGYILLCKGRWSFCCVVGFSLLELWRRFLHLFLTGILDCSSIFCCIFVMFLIKEMLASLNEFERVPSVKLFSAV